MHTVMMVRNLAEKKERITIVLLHINRDDFHLEKKKPDHAGRTLLLSDISAS